MQKKHEQNTLQGFERISTHPVWHGLTVTSWQVSERRFRWKRRASEDSGGGISSCEV